MRTVAGGFLDGAVSRVVPGGLPTIAGVGALGPWVRLGSCRVSTIGATVAWSATVAIPVLGFALHFIRQFSGIGHRDSHYSRQDKARFHLMNGI